MRFARTAAAETGHDVVTTNTLALGVYATQMFPDNLERIDAAIGEGASLGVTGMIASTTELAAAR